MLSTNTRNKTLEVRRTHLDFIRHKEKGPAA